MSKMQSKENIKQKHEDPVSGKSTSGAEESNYFESSEDQFKVPALPSFTSGKTLKAQRANISKEIVEPENDSDEAKFESSSVLEKPDIPEKEQIEKGYDIHIPGCSYVIPDWSSKPLEQQYKLTELKGGVELGKIHLKHEICVIGRKDTCHIPMKHNSVSRYHAVLQYGKPTSDEKDLGFYIYDMGTSNGTYLNKNKLIPKTYVRIKVGYTFKVGFSTRIFILEGPSHDEEEEITITEQKKLRNEKLNLEIENKKNDESFSISKSESGIDWGMGEDADEATDLEYNPYAEERFGNAKETLEKWFKQQGKKIKYNVSCTSGKRYLCKIKLPIEDADEKVEAKGESLCDDKEAIENATMDACNILDSFGELNQFLSVKPQPKDWAENDYYDSDDDSFYDRTGEIEKKRLKRMKDHGLKKETIVHTYESLTQQYELITNDIFELNCSLDKLNKKVSKKENKSEYSDDIDSYMAQLDTTEITLEVNKLKTEIVDKEKELENVKKLLVIATPAGMPPFQPTIKNRHSKESGSKMAKILQNKTDGSEEKKAIVGKNEAIVGEKRKNTHPPENDEISTTKKEKKVYNLPARPPPEWLAQINNQPNEEDESDDGRSD